MKGTRTPLTTRSSYGEVLGARSRQSTLLSHVVAAWPVAASIAVACALYVAGLGPLVLLCGVLVVSFIAYRFRVLTVAAMAASLVAKDLMHMNQLLPAGWDSLLGSAGLSDIALVGMWGASVAILMRRTQRSRAEKWLLAMAFAVVVILVGAILRNLGSFGLGALGEFRMRYLMLGLPVYLALGMDVRRSRDAVARILVWAPIIGVMVFLPILGTLQGWAVGPSSRFFPSAVSLMLVYSAVWLSMDRTQVGGPARRLLKYASFPLIAAVVLADGHRSVWLVAAVTLLMLVILGVVRLDRIWSWGLAGIAVAAAAVVVIELAGVDVIDYVTLRSAAFVNPTADTTSYWRLAVWRAYLEPIRQHLVFGEGLGGYWGIFVPEFDADIVTMPHSIYIQTLVKLGIAGLGVLLLWFWTAWRALWQARRRYASSGSQQDVLIVMGLVAIVGSLTYGTVYSFEPWSFGWIGLALASVFRGSPEVEHP